MILLVFIDGLQYDLAVSQMKILEKANNARIIPGIGFSNNIYPEMLCGTNPDKIGYFNEWSPLDRKKNKLPFYIRSLDIFRNYLYINAGIRKIILKKIFKLDYANIPFKYAHYFKPQGSHQFRDLPYNSILRKFNFNIYDAYETGAPRRKRDNIIIDKLTKEIQNENTFLSLLDFDSISHVYGSKSNELMRHINNLSNKLDKLFHKFKMFDNQNEIFLFSDHGMCDVDKIVNFQIESEFGPMSKDKYLYFIDSTYLRIWIKDKLLIDKFYNYLSSRDFGNLLSDDQREIFGLKNKNFGDYIFRAHEGIMFVPNFYGARANKAMHGYDSYLTSQNSIFTKINDKNPTEKMPSKSLEIYDYLKNKLEL
jgi:hypothetical protein